MLVGWFLFLYRRKTMADLPKAIFKYVSADRIDILKDLKIRFTQPSCFNDPFEALLCIDLEEEALIRKRVGDKFGEIAAAQVMQELRKDPRSARERAAEAARKTWEDMGILSLSATENNLLMWAHYTSSHSGMLIEFDPKHPFLHRPQITSEVDFGTLVEVAYSGKRPRYQDWRYSRSERLSHQE